MSSSAVRSAVETELDSWCAANGVELVDSLNTTSEPLTDLWATVEYAQTGNEPVDFTGTRFIEEGTAAITINVLAGDGDANVGALAASLSSHFAALAPLPSGVEILSVEPPEEFGVGGAPDGRFYGQTVTLNYQRYPT